MIDDMSFQSLFSWMFPSKAVVADDEPKDGSFNPCSLGCFPRSRGSVRQCSWWIVVSILVLLDVSLEVRFRHQCPCIAPRVSILVLLDVSLEVCTVSKVPQTPRWVSILVLLDVSLEVGGE